MKSPRSSSRRSSGTRPSWEVSQIGTVVEVGDGIARIYGLSEAMAGEMLEFDVGDGHSVRGQVMNLEQDIVGAVIFGDYLHIKEGNERAVNRRAAGGALG